MQRQDPLRDRQGRAIGLALALASATLALVGLYFDHGSDSIEDLRVEQHRQADEKRAVALLTRQGPRARVLLSDQEVLATQSLLAANRD